MRRTMSTTTRGREFATVREGNDALVRTTVNGRSEMLPGDPKEVAKILRARRQKTPAMQAKARMEADLRKRVGRG
jgi:hypothetical protein